MKMTKSPEEVLEGFKSVTESYEQNRDHLKESISKFVSENFTMPEDHLESHIPADWKENPRLLSDISDPDLAEFASQLNSRWKTLCRKTSKQVLESADRQDTTLQSVMSDFGIHHIIYHQFYPVEKLQALFALLATPLRGSWRSLS